MILGFSLEECRKALIAAIYVVFAVIMLIGVAPPIGFEDAVLAIIGPLVMVYTVFHAKNHTPDDVQKALEALKAAVFSALAYFVVIPESTGQAITMLIVGVALALGVKYVPNVGRGAPGHGGTVSARGP